jgi:hypothetical protein
MQQNDVAGEPLGFAEIVGSHHNLDAARANGPHDVLDRVGGGGIEARGWFIQEKYRRLARQRTR